MKHLLPLFIITMLLLLPNSASSEVPPYIQFQGKATDNKDVPLNGSFNLTFRIYDVETGGAPIWNETHANVAVENGVFSARCRSSPLATKHAPSVTSKGCAVAASDPTDR